MNTLLTLSVMPDRTVIPEWIETDSPPDNRLSAIQDDLYKKSETDRASFLFLLGFMDMEQGLSLSVNYFMSITSQFVWKLSRIPDLETLRQNAAPELSTDERLSLLENVPMMTGSEHIDGDFIDGIWAGLQRTWAGLIGNHDGTVASFFSKLNPSLHLAGRVFFHLVENKNGPLPFAFLATYSSGMGGDGNPRHLPLKHALSEYENDQGRLIALLSTVYSASGKSGLVKDMIESGELFHPLAWNQDEAYHFLRDIPLFEESGILCRIPDWWKHQAPGPRLAIAIGKTGPSRVGLDALVDFKAGIYLGDLDISEEEARDMLEETEGLAFIKNRWVQVNHDKLKKALAACDALKRLEGQGLTLRDALRLQLGPGKLADVSKSGIEVTVTHGDWLRSVTEKLKNIAQLPTIKPGKGFKAVLRPYQQQGLNWLSLLDSLNFGVCLADDMGLGKTVQILAFLSVLKQQKEKKACLLVVPASLLSNWLTEIESFFPDLAVTAVHPGFQKDQDPLTTENLDRFDLVITTYGQVQKYPMFEAHPWRLVILDEAQAIKNPATKQTQAVKKLKARNRIAMTGTPVENRLSDLWSVFDFLNPGLLGSVKEFSAFSKSLSANAEGYGRLRKLVSPYILRRLKTDRSVISDLPDKVELKTYAALSKKQIVLYRKAVSDLEQTISNTEGIQRKGIVLSSLMKFKQLCNHPDQITGSGYFREEDSGKFVRLREVCETIYEKRERVLVFTQFREITDPLRLFLETVFHHPGLVLHGSVPVPKRKSIIETFQADDYCPFMVLSLKAGGVGLNLTRANHVVHFDRWWNPAVENQATDRAFRIGQKKNVMVHTFVTKGTIEEKIDRMLSDKKALADQVIVESGETLITELGNRELIDLFRLSL